ncbi:MAG TPA: efflux RND transporter periplasmic adaptor subunit [Candidatus Angelobacter sp.]
MKPKMKNHKAKAVAVLVLAAVTGLSGYAWKSRHRAEMVVSGTLEARNINVGSKVGGRVSRVLVHEGDRVEANQLLVEFDSSDLEGQMLQAQGRVEAARAALEKMLRGSRPEDIAEAEAAVKAKDGSPGFREAELAQARADLVRAESDEANAERELGRAEQLTGAGVQSQQTLDNTRDRYRAAKAQSESARFAVAAAEGRLNAARAVSARAEHGFRAEDVAAARAELTRAEGELKSMQSRWEEREVRSPSPAVIESMDLRPGDLLPANAPIAKLLESGQLYVMVYVPETQISAVHVGQAAELHVDSYARQKFQARVEQIRQQAEFLPRNVQTQDERVHQVIGVKLGVENTNNTLRAGVSADVRFVQEKN